MSKIICTGGAGFIFSHLTNRLIDEGHEVVVIDDLSGGSLDNVDKRAKFYEADCRDAPLMDEIIKKEGCEILYMGACNAAENRAQFSPIEITSRIYDGFIKTLTPFIKYGGKRFIFASSIAVYGMGQVPFKETDKPEPEDLYGLSKLMCEETLKIMSKVHDFEYVITRPHNVYGERQNMTDPYRNVVTIFMNSIMKGEPYNIYGDGEQRRCFSYIHDVVEALNKCAFDDVAGMTFNIGSDKDYSVNELAEAIGGEHIYVPERAQEVKIAISDHTQAKKYLAYDDRTSLKDGIKLTWNWAFKKGYQEPIYDELEIINDKVPKNWLKK